MTTNLRSRNLILVGTLLAACAATVIAFTSSKEASGTQEFKSSTPGEFWPPFEARVVSQYSFPGTEESRAVYSIDYRGRHDWTRQTLEDSHSPNIGEVRTYRANEVVISRPLFPDQVKVLEPGQIAGPGPWLALWSELEQMQERQEGTTLRLTEQSTIRCADQCPPGTEGSYEFSRLVIVDKDSNIPLLVEEHMNGAVVERHELVDFRLK